MTTRYSFYRAVLLPALFGFLIARYFVLNLEKTQLRDELATARREQAISQQATADLWQTINRAMEQ